MKAENIKSNIPKADVFLSSSSFFDKPQKIVSAHYHDELELITVYEGRFLCTVDGEDFVAEAGDVVFINGGIPHETAALEKNTRYGLLQFRESSFIDTDIRKIIKYSVKLQSLDGSPVRILRLPELRESIEVIFFESQNKLPAYEIMIRAAITKVLAILYRNDILSDGERVFASAPVQKILPAMIYINQNYAEDISLEKVSDAVGFDKSYFCRIFKTAVGATFTEYLNFVRICKAQKLLSSAKMTILEVSSAVGFSSVSYFNKLFKRYKNCSPSFYRSAKYCNKM